jgi:hypothetical protein
VPETQPEAITAENLVELRRQADDVLNINHMVPDARDTRHVPSGVVEAMNALGDRYAPADLTATSEEQVRVMTMWCQLLPHLNLVPLNHEPDQADWHWSGVRCILAGAGYEAHKPLAAHLLEVYPQCPFQPDETLADWTRALATAHQQSGIPVCLARIPWTAYHDLPTVDAEASKDMGLAWATAAALLHILKHVRVHGNEVRVMYRGTAAFYRRDDSTNVLGAQPRLIQGVLASLKMRRIDGRNAEHAVMSLGASRCMGWITFSSLLPVTSLAQAPGTIIVGTFTALAPDPSADGWFQHGLRLTNAWSVGESSTRLFGGSDDTIMGYAWNTEALEEGQAKAYEILAEAVPATFEVDSPTTILRHYQPNFVTDWVGDNDAYESLLDSVLCVAVMRGQLPGSRREFPIVWVLPDVPTQKESTDQGKTAAVGAFAGAMTPGILVSRPPDTNSSPDMRVVAGMIRHDGTIALDEWAMPRTQTHPLSSRNLQTLATGGVVPMGEVLANNPSPVMLSQPIVAGAKCISIPEDIRNRSLFIFLRKLDPTERNNIRNYTAVTSGEVALRMRLAALGLVRRFGLANLSPQASTGYRFSTHLAVAKRLYELRTGKSGPEALCAIEGVLRAMEARTIKHDTDADESGLASEMATGDAVQVRAHDVFSGLNHAELVTLRDLSIQEVANGCITAGQLLRLCAKRDENARTIRGLITGLTGTPPRANDRSLCMAFAHDLARHMPEVGSEWSLPDLAGLDGWRLKRVANIKNTLRVSLHCGHPTQVFATP